jgi:hypothetical protein
MKSNKDSHEVTSSPPERGAGPACRTVRAGRGEVLKEGIDYYLEEGLMVFTSTYHLKRGYCCQNTCRHCPYGIDKKINDSKNPE